MIDLGTDVPAEKFIDEAVSSGAPVTDDFRRSIGAGYYAADAATAAETTLSAYE